MASNSNICLLFIGISVLVVSIVNVMIVYSYYHQFPTSILLSTGSNGGELSISWKINGDENQGENIQKGKSIRKRKIIRKSKYKEKEFWDKEGKRPAENPSEVDISKALKKGINTSSNIVPVQTTKGKDKEEKGDKEGKGPAENPSVIDTSKALKKGINTSSNIVPVQTTKGKEKEEKGDKEGKGPAENPSVIDTTNVSKTGSSTITSSSNVVPVQSTNSSSFVRHEGVVIATKIHGEHQWMLLVQSMCLFHHAYNHKVLYDIVVFSTDPVEEKQIQEVQALVAPAKFRLVVDNRGLAEEIAALPPAKRETFLQRCNVTSPDELDWFSKCDGHRLAYNWQAEFRSLHMWHHPSIKDYHTMLWLDADAFCAKPWERDPIDYFVRNKGVIMFDNFPMGHSKYWIQERIGKAWNRTLCKLKVNETTGNLEAELGAKNNCRERGVPNIHGFFHITDLDFYRSDIVTRGIETLLDDCFLCRFPDDQLSVTAPAAVLAADRSWDMRGKGFRLDVFHNGRSDGKERLTPPGFTGYWKKVAREGFPAAAQHCTIKANQ